MNSVIMTGRLTKDPEIRYTQGSGTAIASYSLAVNRRFKREGEPDADFFNCVCFGKNAEFVEKYLTKGIKINIRGSVQNENYTNKEGQKVYATKIIVDEQEFAESKSSGNDGGYQQSSRPTPSSAAGDGFMNIPDGIDEELPFN